MNDLVGVIPAAGVGSRLGSLPFSKELFPLSTLADGEGEGGEPLLICSDLLRSMRVSGIERAFMVLRRGKEDIPAFLGDGLRYGPRLAYVWTEPTDGVPFTLQAALPFVRGSHIAFGFPDILSDPKDVFRSLSLRLLESGAEIALGVYPTDRSDKSDAVRLGDSGDVEEIVIKARETDLTRAWINAVWSPEFSGFLEEFVRKTSRRRENDEPGEMYLGHVIQEAIRSGMNVQGVFFPQGRFIDIGTPGDLRRALDAAGSHMGPSKEARRF